MPSSVENHLRIEYSLLRRMRKLDRDRVGGGRPEGSDRVLRRALAEHAHDLARGLGELDAKGSR